MVIDFALLLTIGQFLAAHWDTILLLVGSGKMMLDAAKQNQWNKVNEEIHKTALPLFESALSNEERRDAVVAACYKVMPKWFKLIVSGEQLDRFIDMVYNTQVKPLAKRQGLVQAPVVPQLPKETIRKLEDDVQDIFDLGAH